MTKREWDIETKVNYGCHWAHRTYYKIERGHSPRSERDRLAERAYFRARNPHLAVLERASQYRAPVQFRLTGRLP